jgi:hypothetical protein
MAIDLLGKEQPKKTGKTAAQVIYHQPSKDKPPVKVAPLPKAEPPKPQPIVAPEKTNDVNLMPSFKAYLLKKRVYLILIALIVLLVIGLVIFYLLTRPPQLVNTNLNLAVNNNINLAPSAVCGNNLVEIGEQCDLTGCSTDQTCVDCQCQAVIPPPPVCGNNLIETGEQCDFTGCSTDEACVSCQCQAVIPPPPVCGNGLIETGEQCDTISLIGCTDDQTCINCLCQTVVLPDTELAPLRGTLVKFSGNSEVYLVDWHGELRLVDQATVTFKEGQSVQDLTNRIYLLNNRYAETRQGKDVKGYVDWDPRILSEAELQLFK